MIKSLIFAAIPKQAGAARRNRPLRLAQASRLRRALPMFTTLSVPIRPIASRAIAGRGPQRPDDPAWRAFREIEFFARPPLNSPGGGPPIRS